MRDIDVRTVLAAEVARRYKGDADTLIIHELGVCSGDARIDLAVVNGKLHGYEIKSDADTLKRLPAQAEVYSAVFDLVTIVVGEHHLDAVRAIVPEWWGIVKAASGNPVTLSELRAPKPNPSPNPMAIARLLWRAEALSLLRDASLDCGVKSKPREAIYGRLVESFPLGELRRLVRCQLRAREGWRSGPTPFRCGDLSRCSAKSQHSPANRRWLLSLVSPDRHH
jgi:hypothetical protein